LQTCSFSQRLIIWMKVSWRQCHPRRRLPLRTLPPPPGGRTALKTTAKSINCNRQCSVSCPTEEEVGQHGHQSWSFRDSASEQGTGTTASSWTTPRRTRPRSPSSSCVASIPLIKQCISWKETRSCIASSPRVFRRREIGGRRAECPLCFFDVFFVFVVAFLFWSLLFDIIWTTSMIFFFSLKNFPLFFSPYYFFFFPHQVLAFFFFFLPWHVLRVWWSYEVQRKEHTCIFFFPKRRNLLL